MCRPLIFPRFSAIEKLQNVQNLDQPLIGKPS